jgi:hypothetical protein
MAWGSRVGRYKVLKSVAHNLGHHFVSDVSWHDADYPMGHLLRRAREIGEPAVSLDLVSGAVSPPGFAKTAEGGYLNRFAKWFMESWLPLESKPEYVSAATMDVTFELETATERHEPWRCWSPEDLEPGSPYRVVVTIWDDRGTAWSATQIGTQYPVKPNAGGADGRTSGST